MWNFRAVCMKVWGLRPPKPWKNYVRTLPLQRTWPEKRWMVGRWISFSDGPFEGTMLSWVSTTIKIMVDPISMIKTLGKQWWLFSWWLESQGLVSGSANDLSYSYWWWDLYSPSLAPVNQCFFLAGPKWKLETRWPLFFLIHDQVRQSITWQLLDSRYIRYCMIFVFIYMIGC